MKSIWKYELLPNITNMIPVEMPEGAEILTVQNQNGNACVWAMVNTEAMKTTRVFEVYGTGHQLLPYEKKYIGTFQIDGGALVFHVFERVLS